MFCDGLVQGTDPSLPVRSAVRPQCAAPHRRPDVEVLRVLLRVGHVYGKVCQWDLVGDLEAALTQGAAGVLGVDEAIVAEDEVALVHGVPADFQDLSLPDELAVGLDKAVASQPTLQREESLEVVLKKTPNNTFINIYWPFRYFIVSFGLCSAEASIHYETD